MRPAAGHPGDGTPRWAEHLAPRGATLGPPMQAHPGRPWTIGITTPVRGAEGELAGALVLTVQASQLRALLRNPLPAGGAVTLLDANGYIVARLPELPGGLDGSAASALKMWRGRQGPDRSLVATGPDGVDRVFALAPVGATGWYAGAGMPVATVYAPVRAATLRYGLAALALLAGCAGLVVLLARRIVLPLGALARTAQDVAEGRWERRAPERGPAEVAAVAAGFNHMLERLPLLQKQLAESEERHRTLIEKLSRHVPGMLFEYRVEPDGRSCMPFASEHIREMYELAPADVLHDAAPLQQRIHPDDRGRVRAAIASAWRADAALEVEYRVQLPRAGERHHMLRSQAQRVPGGGALWWGCAVDITGLKAAERGLQELNESLERRIAQRTADLAAANQALESFSYSVAHDLRAPLQAVQGFSSAIPELIERGDTERAAHLSARVSVNARRMSELVDGLLALARAGRAALKERPVALQALVEEVLAELHAPTRAQVQVQALPVVQGDAARLRQVWWNLLSNALKYSAGQPRPQVQVEWSVQPCEVVFTVRDNGVGFDSADAGELFRPFRRLHAGAFEGMGVGLALARRIVEAHGGRIWAEGAPDQGANFHFSLPRARLR